MKKIYIYLFLCMFLSKSLYAGETSKPRTLIWKSNCSYSPDDMVLLHLVKKISPLLSDLKVLDYDYCIETAREMARSAKIVHSKTDPNKPVFTSWKETKSIDNLFFRRLEDLEYYDRIIICNFNNLSPICSVADHFKTCYQHLTENGKLIGFIKTQSDIRILQKILDMLYPQIYKAISSDKRKECKLSAPPQESSNDFIAFQDLPYVSWQDFSIHSYQQKKYNVIIKDIEKYKLFLQKTFTYSVEKYQIAPKKLESLQAKFVALAIEKLKCNSEGDLLYPVSFTQVFWRLLISHEKS